MATIGLAFLVIAFAAAIAAVICLFAGVLAKREALSRFGRLAVLVCGVALLACCLVLVVCFMAGDVSSLYVLE